MRSRLLLTTSLLVALLAACEDPGSAPGGLVLAHASDPHLLDGKRPTQQRLNRTAFARMMDTLRVMTGSARPRYLVITGDLGIEGTDPRYVAKPGNDTTRPNPALARARLDTLASLVAGQIREGPFQDVFFVPGNNDVYLEDANPTTWNHVDTLVKAVQSRLGSGRRFVDLTACYRADTVSVDRCIARIDSPYVLVGFPSMSFKNASLDTAEHRKFVDTLPGARLRFDSAMQTRVRRHDTLHAAMLDRLREVLNRVRPPDRVILLTHIPDLDDPYAVGQLAGRVPPAEGLRLSMPATPDAWNVSPEVFAAWKRIVDSRQVLGVLAGHFHDSHRETYYRPYRWSRSAGRADRWKVFVTPPLSIKSQDTSPFTARGFSLLTLGGGEIRRRLYWYELEPERFVPERTEEPSRADTSAAALNGRPASPLDPSRSLAHGLVFGAAVLAALVAAMLWRPALHAAPAAKEAGTTPPAGTTAGEAGTPAAGSGGAVPPGATVRPPAPRRTRLGARWKPPLMALLAGALTAFIATGILQAVFGTGWGIWPFALFWLAAFFAVVILIRTLILPLLAAKRAERIERPWDST